jgi:NAD(P)-dependent dehydrogenase (short-subunit alcohol dehydrogenase family)
MTDMTGDRRRGRRLDGATALVTGSSRGLGLLLAEELARRGCRLLLCARDPAELAVAERRVAALGVPVRTLACDLTEERTPERLLGTAQELYGGLDLLVNNAGTIQVAPLETLAEEDFRYAMELMYFAPLRLTLAALPLLRASGRGTVVNISSLGGRIAPPHLLPYAGAKFALTGLSEGLRAELAPQGVSVTTVFPGTMRTGSHHAAEFGGQARREYAWFAAGAALPLVSADPRRAARAIVRAADRRRPELAFSPMAKVVTRLHGVAPATTARMLGLTARVLPGPGERPERHVPGHAPARTQPRALRRLTALGESAARHLNQPGGAA